MVGETAPKGYELAQVLNEKQVLHIVKQAIGDEVQWELVGCEVKPAVDGIAGFLGDHMRATLTLRVGNGVEKVHLFIKRLPLANKPKAEFIDKANYFKREVFVYKLLEGIRTETDPNPWHSKAYIHTDSMLVMPDLSRTGFGSRPFLETLDMTHVLITTSSIARFHAAFTNYETKKTIDLNRPYSTYHENMDILNEPTFCESPWLRACAKLSVNLLNTFSKKYNQNTQDLELKLAQLYVEACDSLTEVPGTINVLNHKDFWVNNILFRYKNNVPVNALLIDFQCIRYGPPTFDLMIFLYLTTTRSFREHHEKEVFYHYFKVYTENLSEQSKRRLSEVGYEEQEFLSWCERSRMFGLFEAIGIFPFVLMDPKTAQRVYDDPETYERYINEDRSEPVIAHARECAVFRDRQLEVTEEFLERYVLKTV